MTKLAEFMDNINHKLDEAHKFAICALEHKQEDKELFDVYCTLCTNEIANINTMQTLFTKKINAATLGAAEDLKCILNYENRRITEKLSEIKSILESAKKT